MRRLVFFFFICSIGRVAPHENSRLFLIIEVSLVQIAALILKLHINNRKLYFTYDTVALGVAYFSGTVLQSF